MKGSRRFLLYSLGSLAAASVAGRLVTRRDAQRPDPAADEHLGSIRGERRLVRGPRASTIYTEWFPPGDGGSGTVIFTHGWCLTEAVWHYQKRDLAGGSFGVVTWDLPYHGHSSAASPNGLSLDLCADALARVVDEYSDGEVVLVGHSLGGIVTLTYLAQHPEAAARIRGAVLVSAPMTHLARSLAGRWPGAGIEARAVERVVEYVVRSQIADRLIARDVGDEELNRLSYRIVRFGFGKDPSPSHVRFIRDVIASVPPKARADTYHAMSAYDASNELWRIKTPSLVVLGTRDRLVNPEESRLLADRLPRARTVALDDAGHTSFLTAHERFNAEIRRFAERRLGVARGGQPLRSGRRVSRPRADR
ncbi:MAG: alpha/beta fold hydrolase [Actinomycetota bacterium]